METTVTGSGEEVIVKFSAERLNGWPITIRKAVSVPSQASEIRVSYRLRWTGDEALRARWGVQWNLALTAGEAPGRYLRLPGTPSLGSRGEVDDRLTLSLVDEWVGTEIALRWGRAALVTWAPVETVSLSEAGFERIHQGSAILLCWPVELAPDGEWDETITLKLLDLSRSAE